MGVVTPTILREEGIITRKGILADAIVSTNDTVPFSTITTITSAYVCRKETGVTVTNTIATNVVTITQATMTSVPCQVYVNGA